MDGSSVEQPGLGFWGERSLDFWSKLVAVVVVGYRGFDGQQGSTSWTNDKRCRI